MYKYRHCINNITNNTSIVIGLWYKLANLVSLLKNHIKHIQLFIYNLKELEGFVDNLDKKQLDKNNITILKSQYIFVSFQIESLKQLCLEKQLCTEDEKNNLQACGENSELKEMLPSDISVFSGSRTDKVNSWQILCRNYPHDR